MNYRDALQKIDTIKALEYLGCSINNKGAYVKFKCSCGAEASAKLFGDKKNLWYCPSCKKGGNIISLAMAAKSLAYEDAKQNLLKLSPTTKRIEQELTLDYALQYTKEVEALGLTKEFCLFHQIGIPKGKTMLAGCLAFLVKNETGMKIAYYGIRLKNKQPVFHKSLNVELYLYGFHLVDKVAILIPDILECAKAIQGGQHAVCNFGLPYLSEAQIALVNRLEKIDLHIEPNLTIVKGLTAYHRFI